MRISITMMRWLISTSALWAIACQGPPVLQSGSYLCNQDSDCSFGWRCLPANDGTTHKLCYSPDQVSGNDGSVPTGTSDGSVPASDDGAASPMVDGSVGPVVDASMGSTDLAFPYPTCNVLLQDCKDPGATCYNLNVSMPGNPYWGLCLPAGSLAEGASCVPFNGGPLPTVNPGPCGKDLTCFNENGPMMPAAYTCHQYCGVSHDGTTTVPCQASETCLTLNDDTIFGPNGSITQHGVGVCIARPH